MVLVLLAVAAVAVGGYRLWLGSQSPEDLIRWRIEDAAEAFNDTRVGPCYELMAPDFVEESSGFARGDVKQALVAAFFGRVDPDTGAFLLHLAFEDLAISVTGETAQATFTARLSERFFEGTDEKLRDAWVFRLEGDLTNGDGGWRFVRASFETVDGAIPY